MSEIILSLKGIVKKFEKTTVLDNIDLDVYEGEFLTLLGPSGCGKTTTLRIIAGLENPDFGSVTLQGQDLENVPPNKRNVNTIFQSYALFSHMNVRDNIAYGPKIRKVPKATRYAQVEEILDVVQLAGYGDRTPDKLSGGQRQRVAIARAIINSPSVLLLDEPLGALDLQLRRQMQRELRSLQQRLKITFIYITHDQEEAMNMSDRIAIMKDGQIVQIGTPDEIYLTPKTRYAATFIGDSNILSAKVVSKEKDLLTLDYNDQKIQATGTNEVDETVSICIRTERVNYSKSPVNGFTLEGRVEDHFFSTGLSKTTIGLIDGTKIIMTDMRDDKLDIGDLIYLYWNYKLAGVVMEDVL